MNKYSAGWSKINRRSPQNDLGVAITVFALIIAVVAVLWLWLAASIRADQRRLDSMDCFHTQDDFLCESGGEIFDPTPNE